MINYLFLEYDLICCLVYWAVLPHCQTLLLIVVLLTETPRSFFLSLWDVQASLLVPPLPLEVDEAELRAFYSWGCFVWVGEVMVCFADCTFPRVQGEGTVSMVVLTTVHQEDGLEAVQGVSLKLTVEEAGIFGYQLVVDNQYRSTHD